LANGTRGGLHCSQPEPARPEDHMSGPLSGGPGPGTLLENPVARPADPQAHEEIHAGGEES